jgi:hypothetical protein
MVGILVHGDNHFIVRGPQPGRADAFALARHWYLIQIGSVTPPELSRWSISTKEFREDLQWAFVIPSGTEHSPAVAKLLEELQSRGIPIH